MSPQRLEAIRAVLIDWLSPSTGEITAKGIESMAREISAAIYAVPDWQPIETFDATVELGPLWPLFFFDGLEENSPPFALTGWQSERALRTAFHVTARPIAWALVDLTIPSRYLDP